MLGRKLYIFTPLLVVALLVSIPILHVLAGGRITAITSGLWDAPKPKFHRDQVNSGRSEYTGPTQTPTIAWIFDPTRQIPGIQADKTVTGFAPPLLGPDGTVYYYITGDGVGHDMIIIAVNPDGTLKAYYPFDLPNACESVFTPLTIGEDGTFYFATEQSTSSSECQDNTDPPHLYALNPDGSLKWRLALPGTHTGGFLINIAPDGTLYAFSYGSQSYVVAVEDRGASGAIKWTSVLSSGSGIGATVDDSGRIYVSTRWEVAAYDSDGNLLWEDGNWPVRSLGRIAVPVLDSTRNVLYIAARDTVVAFNPETGSRLWVLTDLPAHSNDTTAALGPDGTIYVTVTGDGSSVNSQPYVCAVAPTGSLKWCREAVGSYATNYQIGSPVSDAQGNVYALTTQGFLVGFSPTGDLLFRVHDYSFDFVDCKAWDGASEVTLESCGGLYIASTHPESKGKLVFLANENSTDLSVTSSVDSNTPSLGETLTLTVTVSNGGPHEATNVVVDDQLPPGLLYLTSSATQGTYHSETGTWDIGTLSPNTKVTLTLEARVNTTETVTNTATVTSDACDYASFNNTASTVIRPTYLVGSLGDWVWSDTDGDGIQDASETQGVAFVPLHVTGVDVLDHHVDITVTSSITGYYRVDDLLPGTYTVTAPAAFGGFVLTTPGVLTTTLEEGHMADFSLDFGYIAPTAVSLLSFTARVEHTLVRLQWKARFTDTPPTFTVWRSDGKEWTPLNALPVEPVSISGPYADYVYWDSSVKEGGVYYYRLQDDTGHRFGPWTVIVSARSFRGHETFLPIMIR